MTQFADLGLSSDLLKVLPELGIVTPSEIQEKAIPLLLNDYNDFIGMAQTGTGKTAAFGLPLLDSIDFSNKGIQGIVLAPTRELCLQITEQLTNYSKYLKGVKIVAVYGGANIVNQMKDLKRTTHIVVATPGRLIDLLNRRALSFDDVRIAVLDEADEMLNMGFREDIDTILSKAPEERATWLFSATMSKDIRKIVESYMTDPQEVKINRENIVNERIEHLVLQTGGAKDAKRDALKHYLDVYENVRGVVFCRTKAETKDVSDELRAMGYSIDAINGDLSQNTREKVMKKFKDHQLDVLVATDVAARGIDVNDLTHVFHFNIPDDLEYYTHRSGRTARAGKSGLSIVFARKSEMRKVKFLEQKLNISFEETKLPGKKDLVITKLNEMAINLASVDPVKDIPQEVVTNFLDQLNDYSKEELIARLMTAELKRLDFSFSKNYDVIDDRRDDRRERRSDRSDRGDRRDGRSRDGDRRERRSDRPERSERGDRGDRREGRSRDGDRKERPERKARSQASSAGFTKFFMNVGKVDGIDKADLIDFISNQANVKRKTIGKVEIKDKLSFFEIESDKSNGLSNYFEGMEINGRALKVNKED